MYEFWREIFVPDCGTFLEIWIFDTDASDYELLLPFVVQHYSGRYVRDGVELDLPDYETILSDYNIACVTVKLNVAGVLVRIWFHSETAINLDLLPDDVDTHEKAAGIFDLMMSLAKVFGKRVVLTGEGVDREWAESHCVCSARPTDDVVVYHQSRD